MNNCKYCNKPFNNWRQQAGHTVMCKSNPNREDIIKKYKTAKEKQYPTKTYNLICQKCNKNYVLNIKEHKYIKGKYKKYCSIKCARSHVVTQEHKEKTSKKLKGKNCLPIIKINCIICNKLFEVKDFKIKRKTCSKECKQKYLSKKLKGKTGGYKIGGGSNYSKKGYYKNVWMDSSWELLFAELCDKYNIKWIRDKTIKIEYEIKNQKYNYNPDFYIPNKNEYIEIKGRWYPSSKLKMKNILLQHPEKIIKILENKNDIINYVKNNAIIA